MDRQTLKMELKKAYLKKGIDVAQSTLNSITNGNRKPRYEIMVELYPKVPFTAWLDIKSYLNDSTKQRNKSNTKREEKVS